MMTSRTKRQRVVPVLLAASAVLAACGGSDTASDPTTEATEVAASGSSIVNPVVKGDEILTTVRTGFLTIDGSPRVEFAVTEIDTEFEGGGAILAQSADEATTVIVPVDLAKEEAVGIVLMIDASGRTHEASDVAFSETASGGIAASGSFLDGAAFDMELEIGAGTSTFELDGHRAIVRGDLGSAAFEQVSHLVDHHPEVDTLVLQDVPGSVNDEVNVETGRLVRNAGYTTLIPSDGQAASGGVDLFAAGVERIAEPGARLGIHSWCCASDNTPVADLPRDDPQHAAQLSYFSEMLGETDGPDFYFQTLEAAPFDDVHIMTDAELAASTITTNR